LEINKSDIYTGLGAAYDRMTGDAARWKTTAEQYRPFLEQWKPNSILDIGCGTGGEAVALAKLGLKVIGVDATPQFIDIARSKAASENQALEFYIDDMTRLQNIADDSADLIICSGNTLPHILTIDDLYTAMRQFYRVAAAEGHIILQWLNYRPILHSRQRLVGLTGAENEAFLRFYDFNPNEMLTFNILHCIRLEKWRVEWHSTTLKPWLADDVGMALRRAGWRDIEIAADIKRTAFEPDSSKDVTLLAKKFAN